MIQPVCANNGKIKCGILIAEELHFTQCKAGYLSFTVQTASVFEDMIFLSVINFFLLRIYSDMLWFA